MEDLNIGGVVKILGIILGVIFLFNMLGYISFGLFIVAVIYFFFFKDQNKEKSDIFLICDRTNLNKCEEYRKSISEKIQKLQNKD